ncbi:MULTISPECIES: carbonic anhydrase [unclassified Paenibacillus]|uniref:carbonic anhydrase n=1 Tax=unclassified Paenibacillus TaxID=185978 RepID=UPI00278176C8|nr:MULTISPECIES: carbonic anhydrase [unclassified Paenibacillus]MDQ0901052.1 carbonic anhydrase [Paenibacillus sp. V4I7]MDQ0920444.1 carbonic anhydrase [Paenibacillus sp. V4I5]
MNGNTVIRGMMAVVLTLPLAACAAQNSAIPSSSTSGGTVATTTKPAHWSYSGDTGPAKWTTLDPQYAACANGSEQSPIDIELSQLKVDKELGKFETNYKPTVFTLMNNGHTIQANDASGSNIITVEGKVYTLVQLHFHKPSENQINGKTFDMEMHLVHKNSEGKLAVLGVLIKSGSENKQLAEMFSKLPKEETKEDLKLDQVIDLNALLPQDKKAFRYKGSLTTPPCSEGVDWTVLEETIELSDKQIQGFGAIFSDDHRPVQPLNGRTVVTQ